LSIQVVALIDKIQIFVAGMFLGIFIMRLDKKELRVSSINNVLLKSNTDGQTLRAEILSGLYGRYLS
jgi:uncharacterized membrane-anchored protein YhcB (DUF1043 family)